MADSYFQKKIRPENIPAGAVYTEAIFTGWDMKEPVVIALLCFQSWSFLNNKLISRHGQLGRCFHHVNISRHSDQGIPYGHA